ncbi:FecR family protein [Seonamhaeicola algicola]|uniref:FecR family protein n=2 Tax=Seonamhaeicola TaxID=1649495 RepID=A0A5C7B3K1_9FLAO|nr:FecR family protein [Seonamhaeicola algicola]TXE13125.1 FecR family protein [Seonamhaeicola algicola]
MNQKKIDRIIVKLIDNTISEKESEILKAWLQNKANLEYFNAFVEVNHLTNALHKFPYTNALNKSLQQINKKRLHVKRLFRYGIAASVIALLGFGYFMLNNNTNSVKVATQNNIHAGTNKATLTLEDGSKIALEKGQNYINNNIKSNGKELIYSTPATTKQSISYNYLTIPRGGQFLVNLSDGTKVWLNSDSQLKYPTNFIEGETRTVELVYGEAYFDVSPSTINNGTKFKVLNNHQTIEVLGTEFNIKAYKEDTHILTTLVEGKVMVTNHTNSTVLKPNQQSIITPNNNKIIVNTINVYNEISWKDGVFSFKNKPLKEIMMVLSRWYNVDVNFKNKNIEHELFGGSFDKTQNIEEILTMIQNATNMSFIIQNGQVIIE